MQTPCRHCRCKKTQTPSGHEPKTAQTASQKTLSRHLWNPHKTKTIFGATEHMPSLCKHHLDTADAKKPASSPLGPSKDNEMTAEVGLQPSHNLAWTKTKMGFVGSGCEKDKYHLNPSPKRPKTRGNRRKDMSQNKLGRQKTKTKMGLVGSGCEKGQTPPKSKPKTTKNARKP